MSRISVLAPLESRDELVHRLHELGAVQITDVDLGWEEDGDGGAYGVPCDPETRELRLALAKTDFILQLMRRFKEDEGGLVSGLFKKRAHLTREEFSTVSQKVDLEALYREMEELDIGLRKAEAALAELEAEREGLGRWKGLDCRLAELGEPGTVTAVAAVIPRDELPAWEAEMEESCPFAAWERVGKEGENEYLLALVHRAGLEDLNEISGRHGLERVDHLAGKPGTVEEEMAALEKRIFAEGAKRKSMEEAVREKLPLEPSLLALDDYLYNELKKEEAKARLIRTESVVALEGWVEEAREEEVREGLNWLGQRLDVSFRPPQEGEAPPTALRNRPHVKPAENLIHLFGIPSHEETDPTPFVSPFFILFFGMCIGDVGYGLVLALGFWLAMKKLDLSDQTKSFLRLFMYCGIAAIAVGVLIRGYFGIDGDSLPAFLKFPGTMDILKNPIPIMLICSALGLIHISVGVAIEMYDNMRRNSLWLGFCEQGTTLLLWLGLAVLAAGAGMKVPTVQTLGLYVLAAGAAGVVFLSNVSSKSVAGKFFGGLFNLYGLFSGTIGDVASYLRLYALGMATLAIGSVVNLMAGMVLGVPVLGVVLLLIVLLGGHAFNIAINFLSAFVHPLRLQYVEFFGKFYDDGGEPFAPLALETRKIVIDGK